MKELYKSIKNKLINDFYNDLKRTPSKNETLQIEKSAKNILSKTKEYIDDEVFYLTIGKTIKR